jgi:hypothetical protein
MLIFILALAAQATTGINKTVEVDSSGYRVKVKSGGEVVIFNKQPFRGRTVVERDRMRRAVTLATSCRLADDYWRDNRLVGVLDCSEKQAGQ